MNPMTFSDGYLLEVVAKGAIVMAAAFCITFAFRRASAALRHAVWSLAFVALLLLPVGSALLPDWHVQLPTLDAIAPDARVIPAASSPADERVAGQVDANASERANRAATGLDAATGLNAAAGVDDAAGTAVTTPVVAEPSAWNWTQIFLAAWVTGTVVLLVRLSALLTQLSTLRHRADPITNAKWIEHAEGIAEALDIRRPVRLLQHDDVVVPMTYGVRRPVVLLPSYAGEWTEDQVHVTLMHELLHVKRCDHLVHVLALTARALHWFNPLTWIATKRFVVERERACDDAVLSMGVASSSYADHLLDLARRILKGREASPAVLAMARPSELHTRIVAILDPKTPRRALSRLRGAAVTGCGVFLVAMLAAVSPGRDVAEAAESQMMYVPGGSVGQVPASVRVAQPEKELDSVETDAERERASRDVDSEETAPSLSEQESSLAASERLNAALERSNAASKPSNPGQASSPAQVTAVSPSIAPGVESMPADTTELEAQKRAIFAISELSRERSIPLLTEIAQTHANVELRSEAIFWLGQVGGNSIDDLLESIARSDPDPELQEAAIFALSELDGGQGLPRLMDLARTHSNDELRSEAVFWIGENGGADVADELADFARNDASIEVQKHAVFALAELDDAAGVEVLIDLVRNHPDPEIRSEAIFWLGETGDERAADILMEIVNQN